MSSSSLSSTLHFFLLFIFLLLPQKKDIRKRKEKIGLLTMTRTLKNHVFVVHKQTLELYVFSTFPFGFWSNKQQAIFNSMHLYLLFTCLFLYFYLFSKWTIHTTYIHKRVNIFFRVLFFFLRKNYPEQNNEKVIG